VPKVLAELQGLTFSLVAGDGAATAIPITGIEPEDTVKAVLNLTDLTEIDVTTVSIVDRKATGTLTIATTLASGDVVGVNGKSYTFTESPYNIAQNFAPGVVPITVNPSGVDVAVVAARLAQIIMSSDNSLTATSALGVVTVTDRTPGTAGNSKTLTVAASNGHVTRSAATFAGGAAAASQAIKIVGSTAAKKLLVIWYNKTP
jgi:phage tail sheath gpL-like